MSKPKRVNVKSFILNCTESSGTDFDWKFEDAVEAGVVKDSSIPKARDLRADWWSVRNQGRTGACVGFASADGVLRWHYVNKGMIKKDELPSPRFIWMANKETDELTTYPTTFIEGAGTQTKLALNVARKYGCVMESDLPMNGRLSTLSTAAFYTRAARFRIATYHTLKDNLDHWRSWIANQGPILTRLNVDKTWDKCTANGGHLEVYQKDTKRGGHAVCIVGYTKDYFIVRNSWGPAWGDEGFAYASNEYTKAAFSDAYGAVL